MAEAGQAYGTTPDALGIAAGETARRRLRRRQKAKLESVGGVEAAA
jgi:hypothetical protein